VPNVDFANRSWRSFGSLIRPGSFRESKARDVSKKDSRHRNGLGDSAEKNVTHLSISQPLVRRHSRARIDPAPNRTEEEKRRCASW
jgi:hypothetical protein